MMAPRSIAIIFNHLKKLMNFKTLLLALALATCTTAIFSNSSESVADENQETSLATHQEDEQDVQNQQRPTESKFTTEEIVGLTAGAAGAAICLGAAAWYLWLMWNIKPVVNDVSPVITNQLPDFKVTVDITKTAPEVVKPGDLFCQIIDEIDKSISGVERRVQALEDENTSLKRLLYNSGCLYLAGW